MSTERDTHFQGFARLLAQELHDSGLLDLNHADVYDAPGLVMQIIAERAYDLEQHILQHVNWYDPEESDIPDMTEWPK